MLAVLLTLAVAPQEPAPSPVDLRAALEALRDGAQGEPEFEAALPRLPALIRSGSSWLVAGGAYLAAEHDQARCVPALFEALQPQAGLDVHAVGNVLDALIRLGAHVEPRIVGVVEGHDSELFVLLARDARQNRAGLLALFDRGSDLSRARFAAASALVGLRDPEIVERLIVATPWELDVVVRQPGSTRDLSRGGCGRGSSWSHAVWPPRVTYEPVLPGADEPVDAVDVERREGTTSLRLAPYVTREQRCAWRARLLNELLPREFQGARLHSDDGLFLEWSEPGAFERDLRAAVTDLRGRILGVARAFQAQGLLRGADEVAWRAELRVSLHDLRGDGHVFLPRPNLGPGVAFD